jgi:DNA (cytosine-5)-methyltransferase 1
MDHTIPQNRERVFVVSILGEEDYQFPEKQELKLRLKDLLEDEVDDKYFLPEEIQERFIYKTSGRNIVGTTAPESRTIGQRDRVYDINSPIASLSATDYKQSKQIIVKGTVEQPGWTHRQIKQVYGTEGISPTLDTMQGGHRQPKIIVDGILDQPTWIEQSQRVYNKEGLAPTIPARAGSMDITPKINGHRIRKLMPIECWKLMGFTTEDFQKAKAVGVSDSQLYKQAGNSIVVPVLEGIFRNLFLKEAN